MTHTITINNKTYTVDYNLQHTGHSRKRAAQRGITEEALAYALDYGRAFFKQGYIFYVVIGKNLPDNMCEKLRKKLNNLVVVVTGDANSIVTCYKAPNAIHHIRRKNKRLYRISKQKLNYEYKSSIPAFA